MKKPLKLASLNNGAVEELFGVELERVLRNIADVNTKPNATREITIKISIKPDKSRRTAETSVEVFSKLPRINKHESALFFERSENGIVAYPDDEGPQLPGIEDGIEGTGAVVAFPKIANQG